MSQRRMVVDFLILDGRIAHIASWQSSSNGLCRATRLRVGRAAAVVPLLDQIDDMYDRAAAAYAALQMMQLSTPPDAIIFGKDHMAFAVRDEYTAIATGYHCGRGAIADAQASVCNDRGTAAVT